MYSSVNTTWVLVGAALVFFMQAGFAMVETGFTRAKNAGNIIMKNLMDFCIGTPVFWLVGFGIMFGAGNGFFGKIGGIASEANYGNAMLPDGVPFWAFLIFQTVFCATSATIVSGAMAERTKFISYCIYSLLISLVVYPVSGHWIWGGGFISQMGFHDFAGSCAVHMVGGVAALIGAVSENIPNPVNPERSRDTTLLLVRLVYSSSGSAGSVSTVHLLSAWKATPL